MQYAVNACPHAKMCW